MVEALAREVLRGRLNRVLRPPTRQLSVFISSSNEDFVYERRHLKAVVLPSLQHHCAERDVAVRFIDPDDDDIADQDADEASSESGPVDPRHHERHLMQIGECERLSCGTFFLCLMGDKSAPFRVPISIDSSEFHRLRDFASKRHLPCLPLLEEWYQPDEHVLPARHVLKTSASSDSMDVNLSPEVITQLEEAMQQLFLESRLEGITFNSSTFTSIVESHLQKALGSSEDAAKRIICVIRTLDDINKEDKSASAFVDKEDLNQQRQLNLQRQMKEALSALGNILQFCVPWQNGGLNPSLLEHDAYLHNFGEAVLELLKTHCDNCLQENAAIREMGRGTHETFTEAHIHLLHCQQVLRECCPLETPAMDCIRSLLLSTTEGRLSPGPIVISGGDCSGKTALLSNIAARVRDWLGKPDTVVCILRYVGHTPRSMYAAELVRSLCFQISLSYGFEILQRHENFEMSRLCTWFDDLLRSVEATESPLVLLIDDLHILKIPPPSCQLQAQQNHQYQQTEAVTSSGVLLWLPWNLPNNVHVICTMASASSSCTSSSGPNNMERLLGSWKSKLISEGRLVTLEPLPKAVATIFVDRTLLHHYGYLPSSKKLEKLHSLCTKYSNNLLACRLHIHEEMKNNRSENSCTNYTSDDNLVSIASLVGNFLDQLEKQYGAKLINQLSRYFTCSRFGLTEAELWHLLSGTSGTSSLRRDSDEEPHGKICSPETWLAARRAMSILLMERSTDNGILLAWRHRCLVEINKQRCFATQKAKRATHGEIAYLFLLGFYANKNDGSSPTIELPTVRDGKTIPNTVHSVSIQSTQMWTSVRPIEELWFHLLHTGDVNRIKQVTICNLHFLQLAVQNSSVCYVISILELVRTQILDIEIELVYQTLRLATDVLSKDPLQMACEIIAWLRPFADNSLENIQSLVMQAMGWCDTYVHPLVVPLISWLWTPLPQQASILSVPLGVETIAITHDSQYVICTTSDKIIQMYHIASRQLIRTFTGHHNKVICIHVEKSGQYLVSGSEDTTVIVWDLVAASPYRIFSEHFASVTCVATTQNDTFVISGSDDSRVIIVQLKTGDVVQKLEHHRGSISCVAVTESDDVLVTGSTDSTVCIWSLENYSLLNTINLPSPVVFMDLSVDSTFLLVACENDNMYLHSLTTGSEIHSIPGRGTSITQVQIGPDNCRAVVGCQDNSVYVYDIHTTKLLLTLNCHSVPVTGIKISLEGSFLFTAGGDKVIVSYFDRIRPQHNATITKGHACIRKPITTTHFDHITCIAISKDGSLALSGSKDHLVKVWQLSQNELHSTLEGHTGTITCLAFAPNGLYAVSGAEDKTVRVWGLTLGLVVFEFKEHQSKITAVKVLCDSRRILSADSGGMLKLWQAESGMILLSCLGPTGYIDVTSNMRFAICGMGDNSLRIWTVSHEDQKYTVSHSDSILCYVLTYDSKHVITGSRDTSLKIWDITTGRLTQVLVGHLGAVTCVTVAAYNHTTVFSGSEDCRIMIWDRLDGHELQTLTGHLAAVKSIAVTADGKTVVSGSRDMTIRVWNSSNGEMFSMLDLHVPVLNLCISFDAAHIIVMLENCSQLPLLCLHNHPPVTIEETAVLTAEERIDGSWSDVLPRKASHRILHKEMSLDTYTWQKKYGGPTTKRSSTISLDDFRAMSAASSASWVASNDKINRGSATSSQSSSVSDIHSTHSSDSLPPHFTTFAAASATQETAAILNAVHNIFSKEDGSKESLKSTKEIAETKDLDVAPWEAEHLRLSHKEEIHWKPNNNIQNSGVCKIM